MPPTTHDSKPKGPTSPWRRRCITAAIVLASVLGILVIVSYVVLRPVMTDAEIQLVRDELKARAAGKPTDAPDATQAVNALKLAIANFQTQFDARTPSLSLEDFAFAVAGNTAPPLEAEWKLFGELFSPVLAAVDAIPEQATYRVQMSGPYAPAPFMPEIRQLFDIFELRVHQLELESKPAEAFALAIRLAPIVVVRDSGYLITCLATQRFCSKISDVLCRHAGDSSVSVDALRASIRAAESLHLTLESFDRISCTESLSALTMLDDAMEDPANQIYLQLGFLTQFGWYLNNQRALHVQRLKERIDVPLDSWAQYTRDFASASAPKTTESIDYLANMLWFDLSGFVSSLARSGMRLELGKIALAAQLHHRLHGTEASLADVEALAGPLHAAGFGLKPVITFVDGRASVEDTVETIQITIGVENEK